MLVVLKWIHSKVVVLEVLTSFNELSDIAGSDFKMADEERISREISSLP